MLNSLPSVDWLAGERGFDADWFRGALNDKGIRPRILSRKSRRKPVSCGEGRYKCRNRTKNIFGHRKDWRGAETPDEGCLTVFLSADALTATIVFWL